MPVTLRPIALVGVNLALAVLYYIAGRLGLRFATGHASVTTIWPPTGIALAAVLVFGPRVAPGVLVGAFLVNVAGPGSILTAALIAAGNTLEALVGGQLVRRFAGAGRGLFDRVQGAYAYIFLGAVAAPVVSATIGVASLYLTGVAGPADPWTLWRTWLLGDAVGVLVVGPFLLVWREPVTFSCRRALLLEAVVLVTALGVVGQAIFNTWSYPNAYLVLPLLVWAAVRFHQHGAAMATVMLCAIALRGTLRHRGAFVVDDPALSLFIVQGFIGTIATTSLVVAAHVTERRQSGEQLQLVTDAVPALISYLDRDERYLFNNRAYETWFGRPRADLQGKTLKEVLGDEAYQRIRPHLEKVQRGELVSYEAELPYAGTTRWIHADYVPDPGPDGRPRGFFALIVDRSDLHRAQESVRQLNAALERRVQERTSELQDALRELESFSYSIAHDLRAPLRSMMGIGELLAEEFAGPLGPTGADYTQRIRNAARRMDLLIQNLLDYSRLTREELHMDTVDVDVVLKDLLAQMAPELEERKAKVQVDGPFPRLLVHRVTFVQVLTNLISNGIKFVAPGVEPRVRIRAERRDEAVRLWVEDNGIGIDPQYRDRIFGVFQRLHAGSIYPGTGIGLAIVKKAMERMGGRVGLESEPGKGARFWIELKEATADAPAIAQVRGK